MDIAHLLVFAPAYIAVVLLPGPGVTALIARVLTYDPGYRASALDIVALDAVVDICREHHKPYRLCAEAPASCRQELRFSRLSNSRNG